MIQIEVDVVAEGERLAARVAAEGVPIRLLGGVAIRLHAEHGLPEPLTRRYADLDFVASRGSARIASRFFQSAGYTPHVSFNALHGKERLLFFDEPNSRQLDVFVGAFRMCHAIPVVERIELDPRTIPLAELLLTKLQVVELNEKDIRDALALLHGHAVAEHDDDAVNAARVAALCAADWGLWRTITANLAVCRERLSEYELSSSDTAEIAARLDALVERIEREPKSRAWRLRSRIGERKRWYELPEEVAGHGAT